MADEKQPGSGPAGGSLILILVAAASALYVGFRPPPLISTRPAAPDYQIHEIAGVQDVDARLWQDPFAAVLQDAANRRDCDDRTAPGHSVANLKKLFDGHSNLALAVSLPGAPYPEVVETRRRLRYAVLAALHVADYEPRDEKHIGYWRTGDDQPPSERNNSRPSGEPDQAHTTAVNVPGSAECARSEKSAAIPLPPIIPFEAFFEPNKKRQVVILWIDEDFLSAGQKPVETITWISTSLSSDAKFAFIGPTDSTTLRSMAANAPGLSSAKPKFSVYNFGATAEEKKVWPSSKDLQSYLAERGISYYRTVNSDRELADRLLPELRRRGLNPDAVVVSNPSYDPPVRWVHRDHVALISEWDTVYGRYLRESMAEAFAENANDGKDRRGHPEWILRFSYLRGLDGRLPDRKSNSQRKLAEGEADEHKSSMQSVATPDTAYKFESAEGQSQFDYLRRIANDIHHRDEALRRTGEGRIAAIGVLGSDVYDKLLILQALRPEFPEALFFTTDLDALLLPQEKKRYTRNLLVTSSFGLRLDGDVQKDIPPFRNTYQTSAFVAARLAIHNELCDQNQVKDCTARPGEVDQATKDALKRWLAQPQLFQIGRSAAQPLPDPSSIHARAAGAHNLGAVPAAHTESPLAFASIQPPIGGLFPEFGLKARIGAGFFFAGIILAAIFSSRKIRRYYFRQVELPGASGLAVRPRVALLTLLVAVTLAASLGVCLAWPCVAGFLTQDGDGDPMLLFEGISIWPTIVLRLIGFGLSLWFIYVTFRSLETNRKETQKELGIEDRQAKFRDELNKLRSRDGSRVGWSTKLISLLWLPPKSQRGGERMPTSFARIGGGFSGRPAARCTRSALGTLAMMLVWWHILVPVFGDPNVPARGSRAQQIYTFVTLADVVATLFLIFLVADATLYSRSFIKRLTSVATKWEPATQLRFESKFNIQSPGLREWIDMQFLARRTRRITQLIYLPFLSLALLVVSRSPLFDNFSTPPTLIIAQTIALAVIIGSVLALRSAAEEARSVAIGQLTAEIIAAKRGTDATASQLELLRAQIENLKDGAFAPLSGQPAVKALLLPLLSYGGTMLVHLYALPGT